MPLFCLRIPAWPSSSAQYRTSYRDSLGPTLWFSPCFLRRSRPCIGLASWFLEILRHNHSIFWGEQLSSSAPPAPVNASRGSEQSPCLDSCDTSRALFSDGLQDLPRFCRGLWRRALRDARRRISANTICSCLFVGFLREIPICFPRRAFHKKVSATLPVLDTRGSISFHGKFYRKTRKNQTSSRLSAREKCFS